MADLRESFSDQEEALRAAWNGIQKHLFTSLVCILAEDSDGKTCRLQPAIKRTISDQTYGETTYQDYPLLLDVPICWPAGGGVTLTFPLKKGDEILVHFMARPHATWFQSGGSQQAISNGRMHSLSDAIAVPGLKSTPRALNPAPSTTSSQMRSDDGSHFVDLHPTQGLKLKSSLKVTMHAPDLEHIGNLTLSPDPETNQGGNLTINASPDGSNGNLNVAKNLTIQTITAQTVNAPAGKVGT